jgi:hypothetical protein
MDDLPENCKVWGERKDTDAFYSDSDYVYQRGVRKGELKLYKNWEDVIPILYSIKKYEDFLNLTNFYIK